MENGASTCTITQTRNVSAPLDVAPLSQRGSPVERPPLGQHNSQHVLAQRLLSNRRRGGFGAPLIHPLNTAPTTRQRPAIRGLLYGPRVALMARPRLVVRGLAWRNGTASPIPIRHSPHCRLACGIHTLCHSLVAGTRARVENIGLCLRDVAGSRCGVLSLPCAAPRSQICPR